MSQESKLANICVGHATRELALFHGLCIRSFRLSVSDCQHRPGNWALCPPGRNKALEHFWGSLLSCYREASFLEMEATIWPLRDRGANNE